MTLEIMKPGWVAVSHGYRNLVRAGKNFRAGSEVDETWSMGPEVSFLASRGTTERSFGDGKSRSWTVNKKRTERMEELMKEGKHQ